MQDRRNRRGSPLAIVAALLMVVGVALAGCSGSGGDKSSSERSSAPAARGVPAGGDKRQSVDAGRRAVIRTASLRVEVRDPDAAAERARKEAVDAGGFLAAGTADGEGRDRTSQVTLRVPGERFDAVLGRVARLGTVQRRTIGSDDVTNQLVDLEGRLQNARTSAERLRTLLAQANDVDTIVLLERELTKRETDVETLSGQIKALDDQAELSSIDVTFSATQPEKDPGINRDLPGPLRALRTGAVALINVLQVVLVVAAFVLPFALVGLAVLFAYRAWRRRHPRTTRAATLTPGPGLWANPPPPGAWTPGDAPAAPGRGFGPAAPAPPAPAPSADEPGDTDPTGPGG